MSLRGFKDFAGEDIRERSFKVTKYNSGRFK